VTVTYTPPPPPPPAAGTSVSDGVYVVGQDMQPGTYRVTAAVADRCYWQITKSGSNGGDIIRNDLPASDFPQVTVAQGQDFSTARCGTWVEEVSPRRPRAGPTRGRSVPHRAWTPPRCTSGQPGECASSAAREPMNAASPASSSRTSSRARNVSSSTHR